jgi:hypothetical protein
MTNIVTSITSRDEATSDLPPRQHLDMSTTIGQPPKPLTSRELSRAESVAAAVDRIGGQMREMLDEKDLLVIWLLDASLSLVDDRQRIAERLEQVYADIEREYQEKAAKSGKRKQRLPILTSSVVAFGGGFAEIVDPTGMLGRCTHAIRNIPIDQTGLENVMTAVNQCVYAYPSTFKRNTMIVIWTDESGDDTPLLEATIARCRQNEVRVNVIGPTAVLGAQEGSHVWIHPRGSRFFLPVNKGPDTSIPERLRWPYWWQTSMPSWRGNNETRGENEGWYGGHQLAGISSGFPPYALTRLALQTGGTMTIFDRSVDRGPFTPEKMPGYAPDYRSAREIMEDLQYFPLRLTILKSVDVTRAFTSFTELARLTGRTPMTREEMNIAYARGLLSISDGMGWRSAQGGEPSPIAFKEPHQMRHLLAEDLKKLERATVALEQALAPFANKDTLELLYDSEPSPRWRAWYDLTYGRLLAQSVRYAEARLLLIALVKPDAISDDVNNLRFAPSSNLATGPQSHLRALDAQRLLMRCIEKNPETPWAYLAQRELDHPLGIVFQAWFRPPPPPPSGTFSFPAPFIPPRL